MSKNISNGFVFNTTDIIEIFDALIEFRKVLEPLVYDKTVQYFADECTLDFDTKTLNNDKIRGIYNEVYQRFTVKQDEVRVKAVRDPSVDFQFSILIIPSEDRFYGMFYTEQEDFTKLWSEHPLINEYIWYTHSERPENYTEDEWTERGDTWDNLLKSVGGVPALSGFTYSVIQEQTNVIPKIVDVIKAIPSITDRTALMARDVMFKRFAKDKTVSGNNVIKIYGEFVEYMDTDKGKKVYDDEIGRMSSRLKLLITEEELM